ncbi:MAG: CorA family divalent cation transporter, partial [Patescibacteria group bacterium]
SIDALHESQVSLVSFQTSRTTKHLTAIALVIFPTTLVATIFSMRAENIPFMGNPNDFWIMIGLLLTVMTGTAAAMKRKNLL